MAMTHLHESGVTSSLEELFKTFIPGSGIPFPDILDSIKENFSLQVDLSQADSPTFCARIFTWAATGHLSFDDNKGINRMLDAYSYISQFLFISRSLPGPL
jgi:hypothetical protein